MGIWISFPACKSEWNFSRLIHFKESQYEILRIPQFFHVLSPSLHRLLLSIWNSILFKSLHSFPYTKCVRCCHCKKARKLFIPCDLFSIFEPKLWGWNNSITKRKSLVNRFFFPCCSYDASGCRSTSQTNPHPVNCHSFAELLKNSCVLQNMHILFQHSKKKRGKRVLSINRWKKAEWKRGNPRLIF